MLRPSFALDSQREKCPDCGCPLPYWREMALYRLGGRMKAIEDLLIKYGAEGIGKNKYEGWDEKR